MRGNRKNDGRYIFVPPSSTPSAEGRRFKAIRKLQAVKESIEQLEQEKHDLQEEIDHLNRFLKKGGRPRRRDSFELHPDDAAADVLDEALADSSEENQ